MATYLYYIFRDPARNTAQRYIGTTSRWAHVSGSTDWDPASVVTAALSVLRTDFEGMRHSTVTGVSAAKAIVLFNVDIA